MSETTDLNFLQGLTEEYFSELVLMPLLSAMGYSEIRYNHGPGELGKDIVFTRLDPIEGPVTMCAVVKMRKLSGSVSSKHGVREVFFQVSQALKDPFIHPRTGEKVPIAKAYVVTPYTASSDTVASIRGDIKGGEGRVSFWDGPALVEHIKTFLPNLLVSIQTPERRFIQSLLLRLTSSRTSRPLSPSKAVSLLDVYTAGTVSQITKEAAALASFANPLDAERGEEIHDVLRNRNFLVITADVGAGKTSLLQMLAIRLLRRASEATSEEILPLFIPLHRLPIEAFEREDLLPAIKDYLLSEGLPSPDWHNTSRYVLLLDGFDEIPVASFSGERAFGALQKVFTRIVVTSRPSRLPQVSEQFSFFHLKSFDSTDIQMFLRRWFGGDHDTPKRIYEKIHNDPMLRIFCRTPLMLTLFAVLAERLPLGQLPTRRTKVYAEIVGLLLGKWDEMRGVQNVYEADLKEFALEKIALELQDRGERRFGESLLEAKAREVLDSAAARGAGGSQWLFTRELIFRSSLLRPSGAYHLEFVHLSFQEYFAAKKMSRSPDRDRLLSTMFDDWWRGTWTFFFGISGSLDEVYLPSQSKMRRAQALGAYLAEANYTSPKKRGEVLRLIGSEILSQPNLEEGASIYYTSYGYELLEEMTPLVSRSNFRGNTFNYALLGVLIEDDRVYGVLLGGKEVLRRLTSNELCLLLKSLSSRLSSPISVDLFERSCQLVAGMFGHSSGGEISLWEAFREISSLVDAAFRRGPGSHDSAARIQRSIYSAGKATRPGWAPAFDEKHLRHWKL